ncbi:DUF4013 domain-containing protein [Salinirubrum litoreum]|uniref:DUF4013 domain-containing protein n=1 Tax=Salinirubrum litoreum TaxID=1126234 RepID=A0ABD5R9Z3_9EURY|nr:DUF4013 domain-containing protein [Salinirubrum litoreum]
MISESLNYLRNSDDAVKTVVIGGVLGFLSFLLIPTFLVLGYLMRVIRTSGAGDEQAPVFDDWGEMGIEGVKAFVVTFAWSLIPVAIASVLVFFGVLGVASNNSGLGAVGFLLLLVSALVTVVLSLALAYVLPAVLANFAHEGTIGAGFDFGTIRQVVTDREYARGWVYAFAVILGVAVVVGVINVIPLLGQLITFVLGPFAFFYASVAAYYIIGKTFAEVQTLDLREDNEMPDEQPVV